MIVPRGFFIDPVETLIGGINEAEALSILTDGSIPAFMPADTDWTENLVMLENSNSNNFPYINLDFGDESDQVEVIELVMFNCPQMNITVENLVLTGGISQNQLQQDFLEQMRVPVSCANYVHVCLSLPTGTLDVPVRQITFENPSPGDNRTVYIAETIFHPSSGSCPSELLVRGMQSMSLKKLIMQIKNTEFCHQLTQDSSNSE